MMAQGCTFGEAGCTTRVLNVDLVIKLLLTLLFVELFSADRFTHCHQFIPGEHTWCFLRAKTNYSRQSGQFGSFEVSRFRSMEFGWQGIEHLSIVGGLEGR